MASKQFNARQIQKHDTEADWDLTSGFIPFDGEIIIYDKDNTHDKPRMKVGDGVTDVKLLPFASGAVESVNNKTGVVTLTASDVGADPSGSASTVQGNLNTHTGNTTVHTNSTEKASWSAKYDKPSSGIPKTDLASGVQSSLDKADTALQSAPVTSVNNKTGAVTLTASDVGALPSSTAIHNVPSGGTQGQVLTKSSSTDYDATWADIPAGTEVIKYYFRSDPQTGQDEIVCDHTFLQIKGLITGNKPFEAFFGNIQLLLQVNSSSISDEITFALCAVDSANNVTGKLSLVHNSSNTITSSEDRVLGVPPSDNELKVLRYDPTASGHLYWTEPVIHIDFDISESQGLLLNTFIDNYVNLAIQSPESLVRGKYLLGSGVSIRELYRLVSKGYSVQINITDNSEDDVLKSIFLTSTSLQLVTNDVELFVSGGLTTNKNGYEVDISISYSELTTAETVYASITAIAHQTTSPMDPLNPGNPIVMPMVPAPVSGTLTLSSFSWTDNLDGTYSQSITITGSTNYSKIDLQPNAAVLSQLSADGVGAIYVTNQNNVLSAVAVGNAPTADLSVQYVMSAVYDGAVTPGGAELFTATFTGTPDPEAPTDFSRITWVCDKTYSEIDEAFENGKMMRGKGTVIGIGVDVYMTTYAVSQNTVSFTGVGLLNTAIVYLQAGVSSDDTAFGYIVPIGSFD